MSKPFRKPFRIKSLTSSFSNSSSKAAKYNPLDDCERRPLVFSPDNGLSPNGLGDLHYGNIGVHSDILYVDSLLWYFSKRL